MFKIHKKIKYALTAFKYIKSKPRKLLSTAKEICDKFDIPFDPTSRVLQIMAQQGILEAEQGARGGYRIIGDNSKLTLLELNNMLIGPLAVTDCMAEGTCERHGSCVLKGAMNKLNNRMIKVFQDTKVCEMI